MQAGLGFMQFDLTGCNPMQRANNRYVTGQVFAFGLLLGWMRWASGSTLLTILLHGLINFEGMLETLVVQKWLS
jgi:membrane protease YdiL (CAAX protease family)